MNASQRVLTFTAFITTVWFFYNYNIDQSGIFISPLFNKTTYYFNNNYFNNETLPEVAPSDDYTESILKTIRQLRGKSPNANGTNLIPFARSAAHYLIAPKYGITLCLLEKNLFTKMQAIICYLYDSEAYLASNRTINSSVIDRFCARKNEYQSTPLMGFHMPEQFDTIFITRDPFERFLSGYVNKCVDEEVHCFGCAPGELLCTVERLYEELTTLSRNYSDVSVRLSFPFTRHRRNDTYELTHMTPQSWHCDLWDRAENTTFVRFAEDFSEQQSMIDGIIAFFRKNEIEESKLEYIKTAFESKTRHTTRETPERNMYKNLLKGSPRHMEMFARIYYYDYLIFGFDKEWFSLNSAIKN